jgi:sterol desaturase/sphingolipid hydroxylase (fatty acid hydroxylase superfamily)
MWANAATLVAATLAIQLVVIGVGFFIERMKPARPPDTPGFLLNLGYLMPLSLINGALKPLCAAGTTLIVNALGGGLIELPSSGIGMLAGVSCYFLAMDGGEYVFHRAQHRIPALWALHSLHHSDPALSVSTTPRHFWGDPFLKAITIYSLAGLLFKINATVIGAYGLFGFYNFFLHMNVRVGFWRWFAWLNSPQTHRLHHSSLPEHRNCNFAQFFMVFDMLGGTYRQPTPNEYPPTGLDSAEFPCKVHGMFLWPWRRQLHLSMHSVTNRPSERRQGAQCDDAQ